jgi:hypothetical protein
MLARLRALMRTVSILVGAVGLAAFSCVPRQSKLVGQPVSKPISVFLHVSKDANETDELGGTAALIEAVTQGIEERGFQYRLYTSDDDRPPAPRIEVWVERWDPSNRGARAGAATGGVLLAPAVGAVLLIALSGTIVVASRLFRDGDVEPAAVLGYTGSITSSSEMASVRKGSSVGSAIVDDAFAHHPHERMGQCLLQVCQ